MYLESRDRGDMLLFALFFTALNQSLLGFLEEKKGHQLEERVREAICLFKKRRSVGKDGSELSYSQLVVFLEHLKKHKNLQSELLLLLNSCISKAKKKKIARRVLDFSFKLCNECLWRFRTGG